MTKEEKMALWIQMVKKLAFLLDVLTALAATVEKVLARALA